MPPPRGAALCVVCAVCLLGGAGADIVINSGGWTDPTEGDAGTASLTVVLDAQPNVGEDVIIRVTIENTGSDTAPPQFFSNAMVVAQLDLTFTNSDWNTAQPVEVKAQNDDIVDGAKAFNVKFTPTSNGVTYTISEKTFAGSTQDNDNAGVTVTTTGTNTQEDDGSVYVYYEFQLTSEPEPGKKVVVTVISPDTDEVAVLAGRPAAVTFDSTDWNTVQSVTLVGKDDDVDDDNQPVTVFAGASGSSDTTYQLIPQNNIDTFTVTNVDDDTAGVTVTVSGGTTTEEAGTTEVYFQLKLKSEPTDNVILTLRSSQPAEVNVKTGDPSALTFTSANWDTVQSFTLVGQNDDIDDGNAVATISAEATSNDAKYQLITIVDTFDVTNTDDDTASVTITTMGTTTEEAGTTEVYYQFVLTSEPENDDVIFEVFTSDSSEVDAKAGEPRKLTFTNANWDTVQSFTLVGQNDDVDDGNQVAEITATLASSDSSYGLIPQASLTKFDVTNTDDDTAGVTVTTSGGTTTEEAGTTNVYYQFVLTSEPAQAVIFTVASSDTSEVNVKPGEPTKLTFTSANWDTVQSFTLAGVNDDIEDGNQVATISATLTSTDSKYGAIAASTLTTFDVTNTDDDTAGVTVTTSGGTTTEEAGTTKVYYEFKLDSQPTNNVFVTASSSDPSEVTVAATRPTVLTFTLVNWQTVQSFTLAGVNDDIEDGSQVATISATLTSNDGKYQAMTSVDTFDVTNTDDDTAGVTITTMGTTTEEAGTTNVYYQFVLRTEPVQAVIFTVASSDTSEVNVKPGEPTKLTFTSANWDTVQSFTLAGVDDFVVDGAQSATISATLATTDDKYGMIMPAGLTTFDVSNTDDDTAGVTITTMGTTTEEAGTTNVYYQFVLTSEPAQAVIFTVASSDTSEVNVKPGEPTKLTFTSANWDTVQSFTLAGVDDFVVDGAQSATISATLATTDTEYGMIMSAGLTTFDVSNTDDDTVGVTVTTTGGTVDEAGTQKAYYEFVLNTEPTGQVVITAESADTMEVDVLTGTPKALTFDNMNWQTVMSVTLVGQQEVVDDGDQTVTVSAVVSGTDTAYLGVGLLQTMQVTVTDDDTAAITATLAGGQTFEADPMVTVKYSVVLGTKPRNDVVVTVTISDTGEVAAKDGAPLALTFSEMTWDTVQTVTLTGVDESVDDDDQTVALACTVTSADAAYANVDVTSTQASVVNVDNDQRGVTVMLSGASVDEAGTMTVDYSFVLMSAPTADVVITVTSPDPMELEVNGVAAVTFTAMNWQTPQAVKLKAVDDDGNDGDQTVVVTAALVSDDMVYAMLPASDLTPATVTVVDDDQFGVTPTTSGMMTDEAGATDVNYVFKLNSQPDGAVTITVASLNTDEIAVKAGSSGALVFMPAEWDVEQTVVLAGVDDAIEDGDKSVTIRTAVASTDMNYNGLTIQDIMLTNADDMDAAGVALDPLPSAGALVVDEDPMGMKSTAVSVKLTSEPLMDVVVQWNIDASQATLLPASLTFSPTDPAKLWRDPQAITVTAINDAVDDGDQMLTLTPTVTSADPLYEGLTLMSYDVTAKDDDEAGLAVRDPTTTTLNELTGETGTAMEFVLESEPTGTVLVNVESSDTTEGVAFPAVLTFNPANWEMPQMLAISSVDDKIVDGNVEWSLAVTLDTGDPQYAALSFKAMSFTTVDDDVAGIKVTMGDVVPVPIVEMGGMHELRIRLESEPLEPVTIRLSFDDDTVCAVTPTEVVLDATSWDEDVLVTVTAVDNDVAAGDGSCTLVTAAAASMDMEYAMRDVDDVKYIILDDDVPLVRLRPIANMLTEAGGVATFAVALGSSPTADTTITFTSTDPTEGELKVGAGTPGASASVLFTADSMGPGPWSTEQTLTIVGKDDVIDDDDVTFDITAAVTAMGEASVPMSYDGMTVDVSPLVGLRTADDDTAAVMVGDPSGPTSEDGATATIEVSLATEPTGDVTVMCTPLDATEASSAAGLTFTPTNWMTAQSCTLTGVDDAIDDGDVDYDVTFTVASKDDGKYPAITVPNAPLVNTDNGDAAGVELRTLTDVTGENGAKATFEYKLLSEPVADVTLLFEASDDTEGMMVIRQFVVAPADWATAKTATVTGVDDDVEDGDVPYAVAASITSAGDAKYQNLGAPSLLSFTNEDNDEAGLEVDVARGDGLTTTEAGGTDRFKLRLTSRPVNVVPTIELDVGNGAEGRLSQETAAFNELNWNVWQTITVTGLDDDVDDGDQSYFITGGVVGPGVGSSEYADVEMAPLNTTNENDDHAGIDVSPLSGSTSELGRTATFTVALTAKPSAPVTIPVESKDPGEATVSVSQLVFTRANWNVQQTVTLTGLNDNSADGDQPFDVVMGPAVSQDGQFSGVEPASGIIRAVNVKDPDEKEDPFPWYWIVIAVLAFLACALLLYVLHKRKAGRRLSDEDESMSKSSAAREEVIDVHPKDEGEAMQNVAYVNMKDELEAPASVRMAGTAPAPAPVPVVVLADAPKTMGPPASVLGGRSIQPPLTSERALQTNRNFTPRHEVEGGYTSMRDALPGPIMAPMSYRADSPYSRRSASALNGGGSPHTAIPGPINPPQNPDWAPHFASYNASTNPIRALGSEYLKI